MIRLSSAPTWICFALLFITASGTLAEDSRIASASMRYP